MNPAQSFTHQDYTIAWICALPCELGAAISVLDEEHSPLLQNVQDNNSYTLGRIGQHNVVLACLPTGQFGTNSAATVASQLRCSFPSVRFGLLVGVGGGVPSNEHDIRLGDVVVSIRGRKSTGVIQYDFGRTVSSGRFICDSVLNAPPEVLLSAISSLRARPDLTERSMDQILTRHSSTTMKSKHMHPGSEYDVLFAADYDHVGVHKTCDHCDMNKVIDRSSRPSAIPSIHYGTIASGNQVMRHGRTRDNCREEFDVLCFEMEAAGLMNHLPSLIIRGICDYADSHKNKRWQDYAATTAAAFAKVLLGVVPLNTAPLDHPLSVDSVSHGESSTTGALQVFSFDDTDFMALSKRSDWAVVNAGTPWNVFDYISDYEPDSMLRSHTRKMCPQTTDWILSDDRFTEWVENKTHKCLWLTGKLGCGKTIITTNIINHLISRSWGRDDPVFHFFYSQSYKSRLGAKHLFESYIKQMIACLDVTGRETPGPIKRRVKRLYGPKGQCPDLGSIIDEVFIPLSCLFSAATYVVDGLDECTTGQVAEAINGFRRMQAAADHKVVISGRESLDIKNSIPGSIVLPISEGDTQDDIRRLIDWKIDEKTRERHLTEDTDLLDEIKKRLFERADLMILWVDLQLETLWEQCLTDADIKHALDDLPKDLSETYNRCLSRISRRHGQLAYKILTWIWVATTPFTMRQLQEALAIDPETGILEEDKILQPQFIMKCCSSLAVRTDDDHVVLAHSSVQQFLHGRLAFPQIQESDEPFRTAELELAKLCITHLVSPTYSRAVSASPNVRSVRPTIDLDQVSGTVLNSMKMHFLRHIVKPPKKRIPLPLASQINRATPSTLQGLPEFFHFARKNWGPMTHNIDGHRSWEIFATLALEPNASYPIHPWRPVGRSLDSHLSALLGWAIVNKHMPLLRLVLPSGFNKPRARAEIFDLPLGCYESLPPLHLAAKCGNSLVVSELIEICNPRKLDDRRRNPLHYAFESGHGDTAAILLSKKNKAAMLEQQDDQGQTPLQLAAANGHCDLISLATTSGANVDRQDLKGRTALMLAAARGHFAAVQRLSMAGAELNMRDKEGQTALIMAAIEPGPVVVQMLLYHKADTAIRDRQGLSALDHVRLRAEQHLHQPSTSRIKQDRSEQRLRLFLHFLRVGDRKGVALMEVLDQLGEKIVIPDKNGRTVLHLAAKFGDVSTTSLLMSNPIGALHNIQDDFGYTPFHIAAEEGHTDLLPLILPLHGPDLLVSEIYTALHLAARNGHASTVECLLSRAIGADSTLRSSGGQTALQLAVERGHRRAVAILVCQPRINVNEVDPQVGGNTLLHLAVKSGRSEVVAELLDRGADVNLKNANRKGALHLAAERGDATVTKLLLGQKHVNVNSRGPDRKRPLHFAVLARAAETVELLLAQPYIDVRFQTGSGETALSLAVSKGFDDIERIIRRHIEQRLIVHVIDGREPASSMLDQTGGIWTSMFGRESSV